MNRSRVPPIPAFLAAVVAACVALAGCAGPATPTHPVIGSLGPRPSSPATVELLEPKTGSTVKGASTHVVLELIGGTIVPATTTDLKPDEGHVHLYVDGQLVSMNYGLQQDIPVAVGTHVLKAEFVAADHAPFNPRIWSAEVIVTVQP